MDIESVYENMMRSLPVDERSLIRDISESLVYKSTGTAWRRKPLIHLTKVIDEIQEAAKASKKLPRRINLFCDTLVIAANASLTIVNESGLRMVIWARRIVQENAVGQPAFSMVLSDGAALVIYATEVPSRFSVEFSSGDGSLKKHAVDLTQNKKLGAAVEFKSGKLEVTERDPPDDDLQNMQYIKRINDDGTVDEEPFWNDDLPRLVQFQLLVASDQVFRNTSLALSILNFVCTVTDVPSSRDFNLQATAFRSSIVARLEGGSSFVPSVNVYSSKEILSARLLAARDFETAFQNFIGQSRTSEFLNLSSANAVYASKNALEEYAFLEDLSRKHFEESTKALAKAQENFDERRATLKTAGEAFQAGVTQWQTDQEWEAVKQGIFAAIEVGVALAATVASLGAASPALVAAGVGVVKAVSKVAKIVAKIKDIIEKLKALYEKFKPMIEKITKLVKAIQQIIYILQQAKDMSEKPNKLQPAGTDVDEINGIRMWDDFVIDVTAMFEEIAGNDIGGEKDYRQALFKMATAGKAVLVAQTAVVTTGEALTSVVLKKKLETEQRDRLEAALKTVGSSAQSLVVLKRAMFDRVIAVRGLAFLDFWNYSMAYQYHTLSMDVPIGLSALKSVLDYNNDSARLSAAVASFGATVIIQQKNFKVNIPLDASGASTLKRDGQVTFTLGSDHLAFSRFSRVRVKRVRCFFNGLQGSAPVAAVITSDARFVDRDFPSQYHAAGRVTAIDDSLQTPIRFVRAFVGENKSVLFEYDLSDNSILCDGDFGQRDDYTMHTPFTQWSVRILDDDGTALKTMNWQDVKELKMEFLCDVSQSVKVL